MVNSFLVCGLIECPCDLAYRNGGPQFVLEIKVGGWVLDPPQGFALGDGTVYGILQVQFSNTLEHGFPPSLGCQLLKLGNLNRALNLYIVKCFHYCLRNGLNW